MLHVPFYVPAPKNVPKFAPKITPSSMVKPLHNRADPCTYSRSPFRAIAHCSVCHYTYDCYVPEVEVAFGAAWKTEIFHAKVSFKSDSTYLLTKRSCLDGKYVM